MLNDTDALRTKRMAFEIWTW